MIQDNIIRYFFIKKDTFKIEFNHCRVPYLHQKILTINLLQKQKISVKNGNTITILHDISNNKTKFLKDKR